MSGQTSRWEEYLSTMSNSYTSIASSTVYKFWQDYAGYSVQIGSGSARKFVQLVEKLVYKWKMLF